ncbi:MAG: hypothetical protein CTY28_14430 [Hyphomicrobium sp.]|nr:MAG: hypothetical protein CTY28_14430 [Hyphomicrobium sp.]
MTTADAPTATIHPLPTAGRGLNPIEYRKIRDELPKATDAQLIDSLGLIARELRDRGLVSVVADTAHEVVLESQPAHALAATAAALDTRHNLGGLA